MLKPKWVIFLILILRLPAGAQTGRLKLEAVFDERAVRMFVNHTIIDFLDNEPNIFNNFEGSRLSFDFNNPKQDITDRSLDYLNHDYAFHRNRFEFPGPSGRILFAQHLNPAIGKVNDHPVSKGIAILENVSIPSKYNLIKTTQIVAKLKSRQDGDEENYVQRRIKIYTDELFRKLYDVTIEEVRNSEFANEFSLPIKKLGRKARNPMKDFKRYLYSKVYRTLVIQWARQNWLAREQSGSGLNYSKREVTFKWNASLLDLVNDYNLQDESGYLAEVFHYNSETLRAFSVDLVNNAFLRALGTGEGFYSTSPLRSKDIAGALENDSPLVLELGYPVNKDFHSVIVFHEREVSDIVVFDNELIDNRVRKIVKVHRDRSELRVDEFLDQFYLEAFDAIARSVGFLEGQAQSGLYSVNKKVQKAIEEVLVARMTSLLHGFSPSYSFGVSNQYSFWSWSNNIYAWNLKSEALKRELYDNRVVATHDTGVVFEAELDLFLGAQSKSKKSSSSTAVTPMVPPLMRVLSKIKSDLNCYQLLKVKRSNSLAQSP